MTIDREHERLMQEALDGTASPAEVERLKAWLAVNELGRTRMRELEGLFSTLERIPAAKTPAGLKEGVVGALQSRAGGPALSRPRPREWSWFGPRARLAYVFAAGIAAGVVVIGVTTGVIPPITPGTGAGLTGSMMPSRAPSERVGRTLSVGSEQVEAVAWRTGEGRRVSVSLSGGAPIEVELSFDPARLSPVSVQRAWVSGEVQVRTGRVVLRGQAVGEVQLDFATADPSAPIHIEVRAGGASAAAELPAPGGAQTR